MTEPSSWAKVEELYHEALARPERERETFLAEACGSDAELLREVRSLLGLAEDARRLLDQPVAAAATERLAVVPGSRLGPYEILERIGSGGMGEVYRARDTRLGRDVAVKVLSESITKDPKALARFEREGRTVAALNHPHVCALYDVGRHEDTRYLVMELLEGETLARRVEKGPLPLEQALRYAMGIAQALEAAHARGIVHRDLKPANVQISPKGHVRVMDFGLAKTSPGGTRAPAATIVSEEGTGDGAILGTTAYMSPEQARGEPVDERTDVWAFGCVLYEALTGRRAFGGATASDTLAAVLERDVDWEALPEATPREVRALLRRCLQKDRERRIHDIADARIELEEMLGASQGAPPAPVAAAPARRSWRPALAWAVALLAAAAGWWALAEKPPAATPGEITSIAVLPLENLMNDPGQDYLVNGMHEALITELSRIDALAVVSRTSAMVYKDQEKPARQIAEELYVDALVSGSVLREGDNVRIAVQLIDGRTDRHLWADSFHRELRDILSLHSEVARAVAREIGVSLTPADRRSLAAAGPVDPEAYELYLRGRDARIRETAEGLERAREYFRLAVEKQPDYAQAWAGLAQTLVLMGGHGLAPLEELLPEIRAAAGRALELDETVPEAHVAMGLINGFYDRDWSRAERELLRALELDPHHWNARREYAMLLMRTGRLDEALAELRRVQRRDPFSDIANAQLGDVHLYRRELDQALAQYEKLSTPNPLSLAAALAAKGAGVAEIRETLDRRSAGPFRDGALAYAHAVAGDRSEALDLLELAAEAPQQRYYFAAAVHVALGDHEAALEALERAELAATGVEFRLFRLEVDWLFDPLRSDPRFTALLERLGLGPDVPGAPEPAPAEASQG